MPRNILFLFGNRQHWSGWNLGYSEDIT